MTILSGLYRLTGFRVHSFLGTERTLLLRAWREGPGETESLIRSKDSFFKAFGSKDPTIPIVSIVVPLFGLTNSILGILNGNPKKELQWRL